MPRYLVEIVSTVTYRVDVDADSANEAMESAEDIEYSDMTEISDTTEYHIIREIETGTDETK